MTPAELDALEKRLEGRFDDDCQMAAAAIRALREAQEWKDIKDAPKDGRSILAFVKFEPPHRYYGDSRIEVVYWDPKAGYDGSEVSPGAWHLPPMDGIPTHFRELLPPPSTASTPGGEE